MKKEVKEFLLSIGYCQADLKWIARDSVFMDFKYYEKGGKEVDIGRKTARKRLGLEAFWSGVARATFHHTACKELPDKKGAFVLFENAFLN